MATHDAYFGVGNGTLVPAGANPTPIQLATLRDLSVKISTERKPLEGESIWAKDMGFASAKCTITAKVAEWRADAIAYLLSGTASTGRLILVDGEAGTIPGTPYQITVANTTGFIDLGVRDVTNSGKPMTRVASAPAAGQYSVTTGGVYTFAAADTTHAVLIRYGYTSATGRKIAVANATAGLSTALTLYAGNQNASGKDYSFVFHAVHPTSFGWGFKPKDWNEHDVEMEAIANSSGAVFDAYQAV